MITLRRVELLFRETRRGVDKVGLSDHRLYEIGDCDRRSGQIRLRQIRMREVGSTEVFIGKISVAQVVIVQLHMGPRNDPFRTGDHLMGVAMINVSAGWKVAQRKQKQQGKDFRPTAHGSPIHKGGVMIRLSCPQERIQLSN